MFIRCLVTSYIFLSAYGNFMYSWNTGDYGVHRYFTVSSSLLLTAHYISVLYYHKTSSSVSCVLLQVIVRYNLLVICLCMVMNRPYQFYYFVPLITFWYTVMYLTAALWPRVNNKTIDSKCLLPHLLFVLIRLCFSIIVILCQDIVYHNGNV